MYEGTKDIIKLLDAGRLKEALTQLQAISTQANRWELQNRIENTLSAYGYMLQYARQGMEDAGRKDFFRQTLRTAYELTELTDILLRSQKAGGLYYDRIRTFALHPAKAYSALQLQLETFTEDMGTAPLLYPDEHRRRKETERIATAHEEALAEVFDKTWATPFWTDAEAAEAKALSESMMVSATDLAVMVSAVTLSLLRVFDAKKLHFLLDAYRHDEPLVNQRALVGLAVAVYKHSRRIRLYPDLLSRLSLLKDETDFRKNLYTIQMQMLITRETKKIDKKMREEIIPEMMKNAKQLNNPKFRFDESEEAEDLNPEWEEWMDKSGVSEKIRELSEWQMAGADVYMSSFAQLKHYPFFHRMSHWFYPFDLNQPFLAALKSDLDRSPVSIFNLIARSDFFCNSDKYSFALAMLDFPSEARASIFREMQHQQPMDDEKMQLLMGDSKNRESISRQYIQDLYRFFKLWMRHHEEEDIFGWTFALWENELLKEAFQQEETLKELADYLLQKDYGEEAYSLYRQLMDKGVRHTEIYQKAGFIRQKQKRYDEAIGHYRHADLLTPDNLWTNKHLAQCCKLAGHFDEALDFYRKVEAAEPDNLNIALQIGQCLARLEQYNEALAYFYKVEYLEKKPDNARRAIAWCSFIVRKFDEARKYYRLLLEQPSPKPADWMNAGHVELVTGNLQAAVDHYRQAHEGFKNHTEFIEQFNEDRPALLAQGLSEEDWSILLDLLV